MDNYVHLISHIEAKSSKVPKSSAYQIFTEFNYQKYFLSYETMYNIIAKNNIKIRHFENPSFWEFPKHSRGT